MINRSGTFWEEVADQIGIFLSVVTGFIAAHGFNVAIKNTAEKHQIDKDDELFPWAYAVIVTIIAIFIMSLWGYFVASKIYKPSRKMKK